MPFHRAHFGMGSGPILLGSAHCTGMESSVLECRLNVNNLLSCNHYEDAGVQCQGTVIQLICENKIENHHWYVQIPSTWNLIFSHFEKIKFFNTRNHKTYIRLTLPQSEFQSNRFPVATKQLRTHGNMWNCFLSKCMTLQHNSVYYLLCVFTVNAWTHLVCSSVKCFSLWSMPYHSRIGRNLT